MRQVQRKKDSFSLDPERRLTTESQGGQYSSSLLAKLNRQATTFREDSEKHISEEKRFETDDRSDSQERLYEVFGVDRILSMPLGESSENSLKSWKCANIPIVEEHSSSEEEGKINSQFRKLALRPSNSGLIRPNYGQQARFGLISGPSKDNSYSFSTDSVSVDSINAGMIPSRKKFGQGSQTDFTIKEESIIDEGRTALNIKNIPNKYTKDMLLKLIDEEFAGQYSFFYLPIDFEQKCNMGFAFIKLVDVNQVKKFYNRFQGKKWPRFNSEKICELRYARLQDGDELRSHFKNSNLMKHSETGYKPYMHNLDFETQKFRF